MSVWIEMHPDTILRLIRCHHRSTCLRVGASGIEIVDKHFEMHLHDLLAWL